MAESALHAPMAGFGEAEFAAWLRERVTFS